MIDKVCHRIVQLTNGTGLIALVVVVLTVVIGSANGRISETVFGVAFVWFAVVAMMNGGLAMAMRGDYPRWGQPEESPYESLGDKFYCVLLALVVGLLILGWWRGWS